MRENQRLDNKIQFIEENILNSLDINEEGIIKGVEKTIVENLIIT